jgi:hypothetical protein
MNPGNHRPEPINRRATPHRTRALGPTLRLLIASAAIAVGPGLNPALAGQPGTPPMLDRVSVFASAPAPGHPFGVAVDRHRIYVSTSAGDFFAPHQNSDGERVLAYDRQGNLVNASYIATRPNSDMGLFGLALDGNTGRSHRLYVADMNGRILRLNLNRPASGPEVWAEVPRPLGLGGWMASMWNDLVFDKAANLYVPDDKPRIWRVTPNGHPSIWFTDPRLTGYFGFAGGPLGGRIDPTGKWLYFTITVSAEFPLEGVVYRVRLVDHPAASDLELVHRFPAVQGQAPPQPSALAFSKSGNLYVSLLGPNQVAVLDPAGNETRRISSPLFHSPWGLAFVGKSLLVTNGDLELADNPDAWKIFKVYVGEKGLALNRPRT